jgi:hypothetical protein
MGQTAFTRAEAQAKVGTRVRTRAPFDGVSQGAIGTIIGADRVIDGYDVEVEWEGSRHRPPRLDWMTKVEYEARLVELPPGRRPS